MTYLIGDHDRAGLTARALGIELWEDAAGAANGVIALDALAPTHPSKERLLHKDHLPIWTLLIKCLILAVLGQSCAEIE